MCVCMYILPIGVSPDVTAYSALVSVYAEAGLWERSLRVLDSMREVRNKIYTNTHMHHLLYCQHEGSLLRPTTACFLYI
jgi:pentatricopeptide repeat protein